MSWISILEALNIWIILLPATTGLILFKKLDKDSKIIFVVVLLACVPHVLKFYMDGTELLTIVYNVYTHLEFVFYWILFRQKIVSPSRKTILDATAVVFVVVSAYLIYNYNISTRFINELVVWNNIFQVSWVGLCLLEYYYSEESLINSSQPFFWFLFAITGYASCTAVFFSLWHFLENNTEQQFHIVRAIRHLFNILLYVFFTIGFLKNSKLKYHA
jgi:hypothetical protein